MVMAFNLFQMVRSRERVKIQKRAESSVTEIWVRRALYLVCQPRLLSLQIATLFPVHGRAAFSWGCLRYGFQI